MGDPSQTHLCHPRPVTAMKIRAKQWVAITETHLSMLCQLWRCSHGAEPKH